MSESSPKHERLLCNPRSGLGMRIYDFHLMFRSAEMYATILVVGIMGYVLNKAIELAERRFVHWAGR